MNTNLLLSKKLASILLTVSLAFTSLPAHSIPQRMLAPPSLDAIKISLADPDAQVKKAQELNRKIQILRIWTAYLKTHTQITSMTIEEFITMCNDPAFHRQLNIIEFSNGTPPDTDEVIKTIFDTKRDNPTRYGKLEIVDVEIKDIPAAEPKITEVKSQPEKRWWQIRLPLFSSRRRTRPASVEPVHVIPQPKPTCQEIRFNNKNLVHYLPNTIRNWKRLLKKLSPPEQTAPPSAAVADEHKESPPTETIETTGTIEPGSSPVDFSKTGGVVQNLIAEAQAPETPDQSEDTPDNTEPPTVDQPAQAKEEEASSSPTDIICLSFLHWINKFKKSHLADKVMIHINNIVETCNEKPGGEKITMPDVKEVLLELFETFPDVFIHSKCTDNDLVIWLIGSTPEEEEANFQKYKTAIEAFMKQKSEAPEPSGSTQEQPDSIIPPSAKSETSSGLMQLYREERVIAEKLIEAISKMTHISDLVYMAILSSKINQVLGNSAIKVDDILNLLERIRSVHSHIFKSGLEYNNAHCELSLRSEDHDEIVTVLHRVLDEGLPAAAGTAQTDPALTPERPDLAAENCAAAASLDHEEKFTLDATEKVIVDELIIILSHKLISKNGEMQIAELERRVKRAGVKARITINEQKLHGKIKELFQKLRKFYPDIQRKGLKYQKTKIVWPKDKYHSASSTNKNRPEKRQEIITILRDNVRAIGRDKRDKIILAQLF
ncbi:MAG: hypothetical protein ABII23_07765, partial [bacterium]